MAVAVDRDTFIKVLLFISIDVKRRINADYKYFRISNCFFCIKLFDFITRYFGIQVKLFDKLFEYRMKEFSNTNTVATVIFSAHNFLGYTIAIKYRPFLSN